VNYVETTAESKSVVPCEPAHAPLNRSGAGVNATASWTAAALCRFFGGGTEHCKTPVNSPSSPPGINHLALCALLATQIAAELLTSLKVPPEAAMIPPNQALDNVDLRAYWPFYEAKKERDFQQRIAEAIRTKLITEKIESGVEAVTNRSQ
jgi:hypothetical protein